jgi:hypothetical protein
MWIALIVLVLVVLIMIVPCGGCPEVDMYGESAARRNP